MDNIIPVPDEHIILSLIRRVKPSSRQSIIDYLTFIVDRDKKVDDCVCEK